MNLEPCYICGSIKFLDLHHYDCKYGEISADTVSLCRRCHRTYHNWGVGAFSPDTTDKAIEVENVRRQIYGLPAMTINDVHRSGYWRKKWGLPKKRIKLPSGQLPLPNFSVETHPSPSLTTPLLPLPPKITDKIR